MWTWPKKHQYNEGWPSGFCLYCGRQTGLTLWQLKKLPRGIGDVLYCPTGVSVGMLEFITGTFDCTNDKNDNDIKSSRA